jgi:acyl carrier protein phosphodiesterase
MFYGIKVTMNYSDHPPPHFHAEYQDFEVIVEIESGMVTGKMPRRALNMIWVWLDEHRDELNENWERAKARRALTQIDPLA